VLAALAVSCCAGPAGAGEPVVLFDGASLEHWDIISCEAAVQDGAILLKAGNGLVQTKRQYGDFLLDFEWRTLESSRWDSGIYFRYREIPEGRPWPRQYQVNLLKGMEGNLAGFQEAVNPVPVKAQDWNRFELMVKGAAASLKVNGKPAWRVDGIATPKGYIALQAEVPRGGQFLFRKIRITELAP
jgi:hypothetical protein